jgi:hypothetical protein
LGLRPSASPDLRLTNWTANLTPNLLLARRGFLADQHPGKRGSDPDFQVWVACALACEGTDHMIVRSQLELKDEARAG